MPERGRACKAGVETRAVQHGVADHLTGSAGASEKAAQVICISAVATEGKMCGYSLGLFAGKANSD